MPSAGAPRTATLVLVAALAALTVSATWAFARSGDRGWGMSRVGPGMMGYSSSGGGEPVRDLAGAKRQAERFAERLDLRVGEVMPFENNYDAELVEPGGEFGTEVLVNPTTGAVWLEYGPAMWNTRYGMMGESRWGGRSGMMTGMMGGSGADGMMSGGSRGDPTWAPSPATAKPSASAQEAEAIAARWLARQQGTLRAGQADTFPGYYTIHALKGDRVAGMLSVNYTGAVRYHWWHGRFRSMTE